jgi:hypothetical protein
MLETVSVAMESAEDILDMVEALGAQTGQGSAW